MDELEQPKEEVSVKEPAGMKIEWFEGDPTPLPTANIVRAIRLYSAEGRQLRVVKTADGADCLHIYLDVP